MRRKILIITKNIDGGTGTFVKSIQKIKNISKEKITLYNICLEKPSYRKIIIKNIFYLRPYSFYPKKYIFNSINIFNYINDFIEIKKQIEEKKIDLIISVDLYCNLLVMLCRTINKDKYKTILTTHIDVFANINTRADVIVKIVLLRLIRTLYNKADTLVFVSHKLASDFTSKFGIKYSLVNVIYNGINKKLSKKNIYKIGGKIVIVTIARLVRQKDHITLFKAIKKVQSKTKNVHLWILSDGEDSEQIKIDAKRIGVKSTVFFGWVSNIYTYLKRSSIFVFSSIREGFGYVIIEAMTQGLPIISTDTPFGPSEILDNGKYGILVPTQDEEAMTKAIHKLIDNKKLYNYYAKKALERVKFFSEEKMLTKYEKIIRLLIN